MPLYTRTFRDDAEVGEPVKVEGSPMMHMIKVFTERTFDPTPGAVIPNYAFVEENDLENEYGGTWKLVLGTGYVADHLGAVLLQTDDTLWASIRGEDAGR